MSLTNPAPRGLASQHLPKTKCSGTAQTHPPDVQTPPVVSWYTQVHPDHPKTIWSLPDPSRMIWSSSGTPGMPGKPGKVQLFWKTIQNTQYIGLGHHHGSHPPLDMWCMYVTSPPIGLCQRYPIGLPSYGSGDKNEWYNPGATKPN